MKSIISSGRSALALLAASAILLFAGFRADARSSEVSGTGVDGRETVNLNLGWDFHLGDGDPASFKDWEPVNLPHDYQISQPWVEPQPGDAGDFGDQASNSSSRLSSRAFKEMGAGWYRKALTPSPDWKGKRILLDFEGIMLVGDVYLNGERVGGTDYGYVGFEIDLSDKLVYGKPNEILVRADTGIPMNSRWYTGGGLFRDVNLVLTPAGTYFPRHPLYILADMQGHVEVKADIVMETDAGELTVKVEILDPDGKTVGGNEGTLRFARRRADYEYVSETITVPDPLLWDCEHPVLYAAKVSLLDKSGRVIDSVCDRFGFRTIEFSPEFGFKLNGKKVLLKGSANHHDYGCLGAAAYPKAAQKRIQLLKSFGHNSIRTSHNPYSEAFLDLCDENGMLVVDELYDKWLRQYAGGRKDWEDIWQYDVREFVTRDRNHPSVVMWSLGNELQTYANLPYRDWGVTPYRMMKELVHRYDDSRPITVAMHPRGRNHQTDSLPAPLALETDVASYNYRYMYFPGDGKKFPWMMFYQSEANNSIPQNFYSMNLDKVVGLAYWGAVGYLGESGGWPSKGSSGGQFDITLEPKPMAYMVKSMFSDEPMVYIGVERAPAKRRMWNGMMTGSPTIEHTWNLEKGTTIGKLYTYTNAEEVELRLNGKSLGVKKNSREPNARNMILWENIKYVPGKLEAIARTGGKEVARNTLETTGEAVRLVMIPDQGTWKGDGRDIQYVSVIAVDRKGRKVFDADHLVTFKVEGAAGIAGVGSGDMSSNESMVGPQHSLWHGACQVVLRSVPEPGTVILEASADGLKGARLEFRTR